ncbi:uncharacterized protein N7479_009658 [Penicillium vulpinum]|uniref:Peptidase M13 N-terminal domain-containing protein n=1 Tax=Penicillium vulpinum TaxID=29845 RepID=A0A1V6RF42_9EURO|nr:uncharacterized protein N7479_009658 [Penicillium vulpinum]KAJ5951245.1 hypothetical protein N7479_009658 [Penicillium vulpinum]OQE00407.1 hypothetical protein PENVUL_c052G09528 [Penicillium vulpinum]
MEQKLTSTTGKEEPQNADSVRETSISDGGTFQIDWDWDRSDEKLQYDAIQGLPEVAQSRRRLSLVVVFIPFLCAATIFTIYSYIYYSRSHGRLSNYALPYTMAPTVCKSDECVDAASQILSNLDPHYPRIDPCTNFEQYACGGWRARHSMRPDQGSIFTGTIMADASITRLRHLLESSLEKYGPADSGNFQKMKAAYNACMDEEAIRKTGSKPLDEILDSLDGIYAVNSNPVHTNLTDAVLHLLEISGSKTLISLNVKPNDRDPDSVAIFVNAPLVIGLPANDLYKDANLVKKYTDVTSEVLGNFIGKKSHRFSDVVEFETELANISPDPASRVDVTKYFNPHTTQETQSLLPQVNITQMIVTLAPQDQGRPSQLIVESPPYMTSLSSLLSRTPRETLQLFFKWQLIRQYSDTIEDTKIIPWWRFMGQLEGKTSQSATERWHMCIQFLDSQIPWILSRLYILENFSEDSKKFGDQVVSDIKKEFPYILRQTEWMSAGVRKIAIEKVNNIIQKIGYPTKSPNISDPASVESYYGNLHLSPDCHFGNKMATTRFKLQRQWAKLGKPTNRGEWRMSAPAVNAYYNPSENEIVFPAGTMKHPVFYGPQSPLYLTYGAFGSIVGHELSHAFDSTGRHYDETGNYTSWWDRDTAEGFNKHAQCFVNQYSKFTVPGDKSFHVNGRLTLGENIADAGGLAAAFHAWKKNDEARPDPHLPGLFTFSKEQLFFISFAGWWCSKSTLGAYREAILDDPHAPKPVRINATMENSREFKESFGCSKKEPVCELL